MGIITKTAYNRINKVLPLCETAIKLCGKFAYYSWKFDTVLIFLLVHWGHSAGWQLLLFCVFFFFPYAPWLLFYFSGTDGTISCVASYFVCNTIFSSIMALAGDTNVRKRILSFI